MQRFTRDITNWFTCNFRFQRFIRDIKDRFTSNFIFLSLQETLQTGLLVKSGPMK